MKLDLLTNATVVDDVIRFVSSKTKEYFKSSSSDEDGKESNEPDYEEDESQLEEENTVEISNTINQVF